MDDDPKERRATRLPRTANVTPSSSGPTREIDLFHLLQKLDEGDIGEAWLAEQTEPVTRRMAP